MSFTQNLLDRTKQLSKECSSIEFSFDGYIYNPLDYAWDLHSQFLEKYVKESAEILFLGMNPGPFGMMQTGVPFGEVNAVKDYLGLFGLVGSPAVVHPSRPVLGLSCPRSEVSGRRLWGLMQSLWPNPSDFFDKHCVFNYCPLGFLESGKTAKNFTPDHLPKEERKALEDVCDSYLREVISMIKPKALIGVGKYAEGKLQAVNDDPSRIVMSIIHPSPGNPQANNDWNGKTIARMKEAGLWQ